MNVSSATRGQSCYECGKKEDVVIINCRGLEYQLCRPCVTRVHELAFKIGHGIPPCKSS